VALYAPRGHQERSEHAFMNKNQKQIRAKLKAHRAKHPGEAFSVRVPVRDYAKVVEKMGPGPVPSHAFTERTF